MEAADLKIGETVFEKPPRITQRAFYGWFVCVLAAFFYCYEYLLRIEPSVMVHPLMEHFGIAAGGLGALTAMYYWAYTPLQVVVGVFTDRYGPRRVITTAICFCVLGVAIFMMAHFVYIAALGRLLIGAGSAFAFVGVLKLVSMWLPKKHFALFAGLTTALGMAGALGGDVGMSYVVVHMGWHEVLWISLLVGLALVPLFYIFVHDKPVYERRMHVGRHKMKQKPAKLSHLLKSFWLLAKQKQILYAGIIGCILYLSLSTYAEMWGIPFVHRLTGLSQVDSASLNGMVFLGWLIGAPLSGWLSHVLRSRKKPLLVGFLLSLTSMIILLSKSHFNPTSLTVLLFIYGLSSSPQVLCFAIARDLVPERLTATAVGLINLLVMLGGTIIQPTAAWILDELGGRVTVHPHVYSLSDYRYSLIIIPALLLVGLVICLFLRETHADAPNHMPKLRVLQLHVKR